MSTAHRVSSDYSNQWRSAKVVLWAPGAQRLVKEFLPFKILHVVVLADATVPCPISMCPGHAGRSEENQLLPECDIH